MATSPEETSGAGANVEAFNLLDRIKDVAVGALKGATTDLVGAPADIINEGLGALSGGRLKSQEPVGGSKFLRRVLVGAGQVEDKNIFETAGTFINPEVAVKSMIVAAARIPERFKAVNKAFAEAKTADDVSQANLFDKTGVYLDKDRIAKTIISDATAKIDFQSLANHNSIPDLSLPDVLHNHPELYKLYPELENVSVDVVKGTTFHGAYNPVTRSIALNMDLAKADPVKFRDTVLHETQHAIQDIEKFTRGGNPEQFSKRTNAQLIQLKAKLDAAQDKATKANDKVGLEAIQRMRDRINADTREAYNRYRNLGGEQESRFTELTSQMSIEKLGAKVLELLRKGDTPQTFDTVPIRPIPAKP
jgi:hypothetical protein